MKIRLLGGAKLGDHTQSPAPTPDGPGAGERSELLQELGSERSLLQKEIEELRTFERSHRAHLKSYLEGQLIELEQIGGPETG